VSDPAEGERAGFSMKPSGVEVGILAAKFLAEKFDAQVLEYQLDGDRTSIRIRIPSRAERFKVAVERSKQLMQESSRLRGSCDEAMERARANAEHTALKRTSRVASRQPSQKNDLNDSLR
jgi:hypothetical protein